MTRITGMQEVELTGAVFSCPGREDFRSENCWICVIRFVCGQKSSYNPADMLQGSPIVFVAPLQDRDQPHTLC